MKAAILGGTGIDEDSSFSDGLLINKNEYGEVYYRELDGIVYLPRHSAGHSVPPSSINYKANIQCLKELGVEKVISIYAVGSITDKLKPMEIGIVDDFIDVSGRSVTFFTGGDKGVKHVDMSNPFDLGLKSKLEKKAFKKNLVYITTNGPRLETRAEIRAYRNMGADVVGMTLAQEATLLKESGIKNVSIAYSINWAAGAGESISFVSDEEVKKLTSNLIKISREVLSS